MQLTPLAFAGGPRHVHADGLRYPLETFLACHGFTPRPDITECRLRFSGPIEILDEQMRRHKLAEARHADWHSVVAVKSGSVLCAGCGMGFDPDEDPIYACSVFWHDGKVREDAPLDVFAVNSYNAEYCEDCQDHGDWEY